MGRPLRLWLVAIISACDSSAEDCSAPLVGCGSGFTGPVPVSRPITPWPPIEGEPFVREVLVLGPGADADVHWESCDWDPWVVRTFPCSKVATRHPTGTVSGGHGFVSVVVPTADAPIPDACSDPTQWLIWTRAAQPIPGPECESGVWERVTLTLPNQSHPIEVLGTITGVRGPGFPTYPTLAEDIPRLVFDETDLGGLRVSATIAMPDDVTFASDGDIKTGGTGNTVYFLMNPESGELVEPVVAQNQRPVDGTATASFEFVQAPTAPVRVMIHLSVLRAFPTSETTSWVVEIAPDPAGGGWSQRTLLPSGDTP